MTVFVSCAVWLSGYALSANRDAQSLQGYQSDLSVLREQQATATDLPVTPAAMDSQTLTAQPTQASAPPAATPTPAAVPATQAVPTLDPILAYYQGLAKQNADMVGWLRIEDTVVDYPVMHTPQKEEKYLHLDFDGNYSNAGLPFMDDQCDPANPTLSKILFGHNMRSGQMFAVLHEYASKDFLKAHAAIQMDTLQNRTTYQAVAVLPLLLVENSKPSMACYRPLDTSVQANVDAFNEYLEQYARILEGKIEQNDQVLVLSTCAYASDYNRLVLIARAPTEAEGRESK